MLSVLSVSVVILSVVMLSVVILSVVMLSVLMLSVIMLNAVILCVVMLNVVVPKRDYCFRNRFNLKFAETEKTNSRRSPSIQFA
jgi:archaellum biogenesis protein FlaJ (TadC family)